jgi:hypothetical protein
MAREGLDVCGVSDGKKIESLNKHTVGLPGLHVQKNHS